MPRRRPVAPEPGARDLLRAVDVIRNAINPVVLVGNGAVRGHAAPALRELVRATGIGVANTFMGKGLIDADDPLALGTVGLGAHDYEQTGFEAADVVIAVGYDLVEHSPRHWNPDADKKIVMIDSVAAETDQYFIPEVELIGDIYHVLTRLAEECRDVPWPAPAPQSRRLREDVSGRFAQAAGDQRFPMVPARVLWEIRQAIGRTDLLISDVGLHKLWIGRMFPAHEPNTVMIANGLAGMGFAVPCAIAAKLVHPDRNVLTVSGDGGFLMNCQELETAVRLRTPIVNIVWENRQFGSIVWKQDQKFGRHFGTDFQNPDFVKLADAFGMPAWRCEAVDDFARHLRARAGARRAIADRRADRLLYKEIPENGPERSHRTSKQFSTAVPAELYIGGEWRDGIRWRHARGRGSRDRRDAGRGRRRATAGRAGGADGRRASSRPSGPRTAPRERGEILRRAYEVIVERADELALLMTLEMGKPVAESKAEVAYAAEFFRWFTEEAVRIDGRYSVNTTGTGRVLTMRQPVGPCVFITPWNFPTRDGHAQDRPGDRRRLHDGRQAGQADAAVDARAGADPRARPGCPAAC